MSSSKRIAVLHTRPGGSSTEHRRRGRRCPAGRRACWRWSTVLIVVVVVVVVVDALVPLLDPRLQHE
jgi:hypothetical protein